MPLLSSRFRHLKNRTNPDLIETYCLVCHEFVAAGRAEPSLRGIEIVHRRSCGTGLIECKKAEDLASGTQLGRRFFRARSCYAASVTETYCLLCHKFLAASPGPEVLSIIEASHCCEHQDFVARWLSSHAPHTLDDAA